VHIFKKIIVHAFFLVLDDTLSFFLSFFVFLFLFLQLFFFADGINQLTMPLINQVPSLLLHSQSN